MTNLTRIAFLLTFFFAVDKVAAFLRQVIIARQFGLSAELDAFNVANNVPDLIYAMISGGALAIAFIPVLTATLTQENREAAWRLFSRIMNLFFLVTGGLAILVFLGAGMLVRSQIGIAPGFGSEQQAVVITLMRLNLVATLIFSISGLVMAGLQANNHFLFPAMAPLMYNIGQICGALILAPDKGYTIAGVTLPAFGLGVNGLVYGVILGAGMHLGIQIPGLILNRFRWSLSLGLNTPRVKQVLRLMGPRVLTVFFVQVIFLVRDNLASRLAEGSVTALSYGWMLQQVPETLVGTAIGTAMLPALSALASRQETEAFRATIERAARVLIGITLPAGAVLAFGLSPLLGGVFDFGPQGTAVLTWTTRAFMAGLVGHCLLEIAARSFYARQDALTPLVASGINLLGFVVLSVLLYRPLGPAGLALSDAVCWTGQAIGLLWLLSRKMDRPMTMGSTIPRAAAGALLGAGVTVAVQALSAPLGWLVSGSLGLVAGALAAAPLILPEVKILFRL
jgi:putative peptidoglycan lipid II flippase